MPQSLQVFPSAQASGDSMPAAGYWDTNEAPYNTADLTKWDESPDDELVLALLAGVGEGRFGAGRWHRR